MSDFTGLGDLVAQIKDASSSIAQSDAQTHKRLDGLETSINELWKKTGRPGA